MKRLFLLSMLLVLILLLVQSFAILYDYSVVGNYNNNISVLATHAALAAL
jgi:hypothetical protein